LLLVFYSNPVYHVTLPKSPYTLGKNRDFFIRHCRLIRHDSHFSVIFDLRKLDEGQLSPVRWSDCCFDPDSCSSSSSAVIRRPAAARPKNAN